MMSVEGQVSGHWEKGDDCWGHIDYVGGPGKAADCRSE
jgi:hypothetical protein